MAENFEGAYPNHPLDLIGICAWCQRARCVQMQLWSHEKPCTGTSRWKVYATRNALESVNERHNLESPSFWLTDEQIAEQDHYMEHGPIPYSPVIPNRDGYYPQGRMLCFDITRTGESVKADEEHLNG